MVVPAAKDNLRAQIGKSITENEQLFFMHVPKTAGTSLIAVLDQRYSIDEICPLDRGTEKKYMELPEAQRDGYKFIRGHFPYLLAMYLKNPRTLTFLRDPVKRTLSAINHHKRLEKQGLSYFKKYSLENMTVEEFLENPELGHFVCNKAVQYLNGLTTRVPGGRPSLNLAQAKERLDKFDFVGLTERFDESLSLLTHTFKLYPINSYQVLQAAPEGGKKESPPQRVMDRLAEMNQEEIELYEYGLKLFNKRISDMEKSGPPEYKPYSLEPSSVIEFDFRRVDPGRGWHVGEVDPNGRVYRWSGPDTVSQLDFPIAHDRDLQIEIRALSGITPDVLNSLVLEINNQPIKLTMNEDVVKGAVLFKGRIPRNILNPSVNPTTLTFKINQTYSPHEFKADNEDQRKLGICYNSLRIFPKG